MSADSVRFCSKQHVQEKSSTIRKRFGTEDNEPVAILLLFIMLKPLCSNRSSIFLVKYEQDKASSKSLPTLDVKINTETQINSNTRCAIKLFNQRPTFHNIRQ